MELNFMKKMCPWSMEPLQKKYILAELTTIQGQKECLLLPKQELICLPLTVSCLENKGVSIAQYMFRIQSNKEIMPFLHDVIDNSGEGIIIQESGAYYTHGRSASLLKIKV